MCTHREWNVKETQEETEQVQAEHVADRAVDRGKVVQTGLNVAARTMARCDRLRACTGEGSLGRSRNKVIEDALLSGGLDALELAYGARIRRFNALARRAGQGWEEYATAYAETYSRQTYPPSVDELERLEKAEQAKRLSDAWAEGLDQA